MGKIVTLSKLQKVIQPNTATIVGGGFDMFHVGHLRYLQKASRHGRPLVVIVQTDQVVFARKGFHRPIIHQQQRAELVAGLACVDYVLILDKPSHYDGYLEIIKPKKLVFYKENLVYRKRRAREIAKKFPSIQVVFVKDRKITSTTTIIQRVFAKQEHKELKDPLIRKLHDLAAKSTSHSGKVSAVLMRRDKIIAEKSNNEKDQHAEDLLIQWALSKDVRLAECQLIVLIPPCITCSELILKNDIKKVFYLYPYGNDDGLKLLRDHGIPVKRYQH